MGFFNNTFEHKIKKILKNKKLSANERFEKITELYTRYFAFKLKYDVKFETYELYYERFMKFNRETGKEIRIEDEYEKCFDLQFENKLYLETINLLNITEKLEKQNLFPNNLNEASKQFYNLLKDIKIDCNLNENFDYESFYFNKKTRNLINHQTRYFFDKTVDDFKAKNDIEIEFE